MSFKIFPLHLFLFHVIRKIYCFYKSINATASNYFQLQNVYRQQILPFQGYNSAELAFDIRYENTDSDHWSKNASLGADRF